MAGAVIVARLIGFSSIPKVAVVPIFVLWFGAGPVPAVLTALAMCFFLIVVNIAIFAGAVQAFLRKEKATWVGR